MEKRLFIYNDEFKLEKGGRLTNLRITYHAYGKLNEEKNNVIWVCHAFSANSDVFEWWPGLFGENQIFNPNDHYIVCANIIGSCYGTTGPLSYNSETDTPYFHDFPEITVRDMVFAHELLRKHLNINKINMIIGASLGGHQALEWAIMKPDLFDNLILISCGAKITPWAVAFNESQRMAIETDPSWKESTSLAGIEGMKTARSIALLSYRNHSVYSQTQSESTNELPKEFRAASYQRYQGLKLSKRFNAFSYYVLSKAMDTHNVGRNRAGISAALSMIRTKTVIIGIDSDLLFPVAEQKYLASKIPEAKYYEIHSIYGHDGFLIETGQLSRLLSSLDESMNIDPVVKAENINLKYNKFRKIKINQLINEAV